MLFSVAANTNYIIFGVIYLTSNATADFKFAFSVPTGTTGDQGASGLSTTVTQATSTIGNVVPVAVSNTNRLAVWVYASILVGSTAGTLNFQWAQNTSDVGNTVVLAGSSLLVQTA